MPIDSSVAELITAQLFVLVQEAPEPIYFYINSTGIAVSSSEQRQAAAAGTNEQQRAAAGSGSSSSSTSCEQHPATAAQEAALSMT